MHNCLLCFVFFVCFKYCIFFIEYLLKYHMKYMNIIHTNCCLYCELVCVSAVSTERMNLHLERGFSNINFVLCMHVALLLEHSRLLYQILFIAYSIANWNILVCCIAFLFLHVALLLYRVVVVVSTQ